jgi:hypothetical protein
MNNDFRRLSEASGGRQARSTTTAPSRPLANPFARGSLDTNDKAAYFLVVHRQRVGALLGFAAGTAVVAMVRPAEADIDSPQSRLETGSVQYGAALTAELLASPGAICPSGAAVPCVIGSGGGLAIRAGYRFHSPFYLGGAYEFSKQDAHKSITLAILQQARAEARYFLPFRGVYMPFLTAGTGAVAYGGQFSAETLGGMAFLGVGVELQLSRTAVMAFILSYRPILLLTWQDTARLERPTGILSMVGLELALEERVPIYEPPSR